MFVLSAQYFERFEMKKTIYGVFSSIDKAKEAIEILVQRKYHNKIDQDVEWMNEYRNWFKIIPLPDVDNMDFFQNGNIPCSD